MKYLTNIFQVFHEFSLAANTFLKVLHLWEKKIRSRCAICFTLVHLFNGRGTYLVDFFAVLCWHVSYSNIAKVRSRQLCINCIPKGGVPVQFDRNRLLHFETLYFRLYKTIPPLMKFFKWHENVINLTKRQKW